MQCFKDDPTPTNVSNSIQQKPRASMSFSNINAKKMHKEQPKKYVKHVIGTKELT